MAEAPGYGIRLLLGLTNGDAGFGGMQQYVKWGGGSTITDFYTSPKIRVRAPGAARGTLSTPYSPPDAACKAASRLGPCCAAREACSDCDASGIV